MSVCFVKPECFFFFHSDSAECGGGGVEEPKHPREPLYLARRCGDQLASCRLHYNTTTNYTLH